MNTLQNRKPDTAVAFDVGYKKECKNLMREFDAILEKKAKPNNAHAIPLTRLKAA